MDFANWARLVRIPAVFTILADVSAAYLLVAHGTEPLVRFVLIVIAGVLLYWSGMIFNDVFDVEVDRQERPSRPLPAGVISLSAARLAAGVMMVAGIGCAALSGYVPAEGLETTWLPVAVAAAIAVMVLLYDGPLKKTPLGPVAMGACRMGSFLLGASPVVAAGAVVPETVFPPYVWAAASGFGVYVMGVTLMARREASESSPTVLSIGLMVILIGLILLAFVPVVAGPFAGFRFRGNAQFALLIGMLGVTVLVRGWNLLSDPTPQRVQLTVRLALLTIIPLAAAFALLGAGIAYGLAIFALVVPAMIVGARFRMT